MAKKVHIVGYDSLIKKMVEREGYLVVGDHMEADTVVFTGGADVDPGVYGHMRHLTTYSDRERDDYEIRVYNDLSVGQLKVGICRGAQFLCVMNGGTLYQDVDNHALYNTHPLVYVNAEGTEERHPTTSTHHQMQNPYLAQNGKELEFELWGYAEGSTYRDRELVKRANLSPADHPDVEILYWPRTNSLGFQGHPEYESKECRELFFKCLDRAIGRV